MSIDLHNYLCDTFPIWQNHFYSLPSFLFLHIQFIFHCTCTLHFKGLLCVLQIINWIYYHSIFLSFLETIRTYCKTTQNVIHPATHAINQKKVDMWICRKKSKQKMKYLFHTKVCAFDARSCRLNLVDFWSARLHMPPTGAVLETIFAFSKNGCLFCNVVVVFEIFFTTFSILKLFDMHLFIWKSCPHTKSYFSDAST